MIDINKPVRKGYDMVLNYKNGEQGLGSAAGLAREVKRGKVYNAAPNDNPKGDVNLPDSYHKPKI